MELLVGYVTALVRSLVNDTNRQVPEVQTITMTATGGTWTVTFRGATTGALAFNISLTNLQATLQQMATIGIGNALVTGTAGSSYIVTFANALTGTYLPLLTLNVGSLTGGTATIALTTPGDGGDVYNDGFQIPYLQTAVVDLQEDLAEAGIRTNVAHTDLTNIPANTRFIGYATSPPLPDNLVIPYRLRERTTGSTGPFVPMKKHDGDIPDVEAGQSLNIWDWRDNQIELIGATEAKDIRLTYEKELDVPVSPSNVILIRGAREALAFYVAGLAARARNQRQMAADMMTGYDARMRKMVNRQLRVDQQTMRLRMAYNQR